jgi:alpha-glucosidase (family GH31 glycosyl hydrolase)
MRLDMLGFSYKNDSFSFSFSDPITGNTYLSTKDSTLVFMDRYIQMDFNLPSQRVFGFGERVREFQLSEGTWTMWAIGQNIPYDDGQGRKNVYGVHPFIMVQGKSKDDFFGIYFRNSNFQSPVLRYNADGSSTLSYITTGGILDVYFFIHGSAKSII